MLRSNPYGLIFKHAEYSEWMFVKPIRSINLHLKVFLDRVDMEDVFVEADCENDPTFLPTFCLAAHRTLGDVLDECLLRLRLYGLFTETEIDKGFSKWTYTDGSRGGGGNSKKIFSNRAVALHAVAAPFQPPHRRQRLAGQDQII